MMTWTVVLVGVAILIGLAVALGRLERRTVDDAFDRIADGRRAISEERGRLRDYEAGLQDWERSLESRQEVVDDMNRRLRAMELRLRDTGHGRRSEPPGNCCDTDDDGERPDTL